MVEASQHDLCDLYIKAARLARHRGAPHRSREMMENLLGDLTGALQHLQTVVSDALTEMGDIACAQGNFKEARTYYTDSWSRREELYGPMHPLVSAVLCRLACLDLNEGNEEKVSEIVTRVVRTTCRREAGEEEELALVLPELARGCFRNRLFKEAEKLLLKILELMVSRGQMETAVAIPPLELYAHACLAQGKYELAEKSYRQVIGLRERFGQKESKEFAGDLKGLGKSICGQGRVCDATRVCDSALEMRRKALGENQDTSLIFSELADTYCHHQNYEKAGPLCEEAIFSSAKTE